MAVNPASCHSWGSGQLRGRTADSLTHHLTHQLTHWPRTEAADRRYKLWGTCMPWHQNPTFIWRGGTQREREEGEVRGSDWVGEYGVCNKEHSHSQLTGKMYKIFTRHHLPLSLHGWVWPVFTSLCGDRQGGATVTNAEERVPNGYLRLILPMILLLLLLLLLLMLLSLLLLLLFTFAWYYYWCYCYCYCCYHYCYYYYYYYHYNYCCYILLPPSNIIAGITLASTIAATTIAATITTTTTATIAVIYCYRRLILPLILLLLLLVLLPLLLLLLLLVLLLLLLLLLPPSDTNTDNTATT